MTTQQIPRRVAPPAPPAARTMPQGAERVTFARPALDTGEKIAVYGPGGIGKTSLAASAPGPVVFFDLDDSLGKLARVGAVPGDVLCAPCATWGEMRALLNAADGWQHVRTIVIDTMTKAEELAVAHVLDTVPADNGRRAERIEDYGSARATGTCTTRCCASCPISSGTRRPGVTWSSWPTT